MPVQKEEEEVTSPKGSITDQVAKESKDSTASDHPLHDDPTAAAIKGNVGDHIGKNLEGVGEEGTREDREAQMKAMNQK